LFPENIDQNTRVLLVNFGKKEEVYCLSLLKKLRENGISSELFPTQSKMKKQMNYADKKGVEFVVMVGEDEINSSTISVKDMRSGAQQETTIDSFIKEIL